MSFQKVTECCENGRNPLENYPESPIVQGIMEISSRLIGLVNNGWPQWKYPSFHSIIKTQRKGENQIL